MRALLVCLPIALGAPTTSDTTDLGRIRKELERQAPAEVLACRAHPSGPGC